MAFGTTGTLVVKYNVSDSPIATAIAAPHYYRPNRSSVRMKNMENRACTVAITLAMFGGLFALPSLAFAQDVPGVISPLNAEPDRNGVNLATGKIKGRTLVLSVPAAPRLRFDSVQNAAPYMKGKINIVFGNEYQTSSFSVHSGADTSESFTCDQEIGCTSVTSSGSMYRPSFSGKTGHYQRAGGGEIYHFTVEHSYSVLPATPGSNGRKDLLTYASSIEYPDGEVISYTYDDGYMPNDPIPNRVFRRPTAVSSSLGYYITIAYQYQGSDPTVAGWGSPSEAAIYAASNPAAPLGKLTRNADGSITDLGGRIYGGVGMGALGSDVETFSAAVQLPDEAGISLTINKNASYPLIASVVHDGVQWNYGYTNVTFPTLGSWYNYSNLTVTGPNGYSMAYDVGTQGTANGYSNLIARQTDALGRATSFDYGLGGRVIRIALPEGNAVDLSYDDCGNISSKTTTAKPGSGLPNIVESAAYPPVGFPENPCPNVLSYRPTRHTDALGRQTDFVYNSLGQLTEQTDPADAAGVRRKTFIEYDASAGISRKSVVRVCGATTTCGTSAEVRTEYVYFGNSNLPTIERQIDASTATTRETVYTYDAAGRVLSIDGPIAGPDDTQYFRYDVHGRKTWEIGGQVPNKPRLAKRTTYRNSDDKVVIVESGTIPTATDTNLTVLQRSDTTYDSRRYPIREATSVSGTNHQVADRSFLDRGLAECTTVRMNLSALPAATSAGACTLGTQGTQGADRITKNTYDAAGQLTKIQKAYGTSLQADYATYTYRQNGKQEYVTDANANKAQFAYDGYDRPYRWYFPSKTTAGIVNTADYEQYGYDFAGNRTSLRKRDGAVLTFTYDALNRMTAKVMTAGGGGGGGPNQPPVASFDDAGTLSCGGATLTLNVVANDTDPDNNVPLSLVSASGSAGLSVSMVSSTDIQLVSLSSTGTKSFSYIVQDSLGAQAAGSGSVIVEGVCQ